MTDLEPCTYWQPGDHPLLRGAGKVSFAFKRARAGGSLSLRTTFPQPQPEAPTRAFCLPLPVSITSGGTRSMRKQAPVFLVCGSRLVINGMVYISPLHMNVRLKLRTLQSYLPILNRERSQAATAMTRTDIMGPLPQMFQRASLGDIRCSLCDPLLTT